MKRRHKDRGAALMILMVVIIIATLLGVWGLNSSRTGILKSAHRTAQTKLQLLAEQGLQKALRRIQEIMNVDGTLLDTVGDDNTTAKDRSWLHCLPEGSPCLCMPAANGNSPDCNNPTCGDNFGTDTDWDVVNQNVVCNFLGSTLKNTQVMLVRKPDIQATATETDAIFLVNSVARDSQDRRQIIQGVIVVPYDQVTGTGVGLLEPYIATTTKGGD
jgi:Tfp pilus assembly protein PilX